MRALVTGGAGFVGRHLSATLADAGFDVTIVDPLVPGGGGKRPVRDIYDIEFLEQDCRQFFAEHRAGEFDVVFHLAAVIGGRATIDGNPLAVAADLSIDADLFGWITPSTHLVYFSSSAAYPTSLQTGFPAQLLHETDIDLAHLQSPDMVYGLAKLAGEYLTQIARDHYGVGVTVYRPFSGYGADQDLSYPVPAICRREALRAPGEPAAVWGTGLQCRDFVHIDDIVGSVMATWDSGVTVNLSSGESTNFIQIARLAAADPELVVETNPDAPVGVMFRVGDTTRQRDLGIDSHHVDLATGLRWCVEHWTNRNGLIHLGDQ